MVDVDDDNEDDDTLESEEAGAELASGAVAAVTLWYSSNSTILPSDEPNQTLAVCGSTANAVPWCSM